MNKTFNNVYKNKRVLVTGHTGFKGSWLSLWLTYLGAKVIGYSAYLPSNPCNFNVSGLENDIKHIEGDIRNLTDLKKVFIKEKPEILFHLAAQPIVQTSYDDPKLTFDTNTGGTVNILECLRTTNVVKSAIIITSDKCYRNNEWEWGYRENDELGGDDPYSASKGCAEIAVRSYINSYFNDHNNHTKSRIATTRAGNVIGGGDWAKARIIPDCVRAWSKGKPVIIRNPDSTRPWQHVLEPLSGYLLLGANLYNSNEFHGEPFNFGPDAKVNQSVKQLLDLFVKYWKNAKWKHEKANTKAKESNLLKLSCDKAISKLKWYPVLSFTDTVRLTAEWYKAYYSQKNNMKDFSLEQIKYYINEAVKLDLSWTKQNYNEKNR